MTATDEVSELAQRVATARGKLPLQHDAALVEVLSEDELAAERELAEWIRSQQRSRRRWLIKTELAAEKRDRRTSAAINRVAEKDAHWHRRAQAASRRASNRDARLAQLYRRAEWSSRALIAVVILGMVWAGVNVQHNLVPSGDMTDPLYWLSFGIEAMISIPIITIMVAATTAAQWGRSLPRGKIAAAELALLGVTVGLNAGPHLIVGNYGRAAEFAIAPIMVGVVIWLHAWVAARYAFLIDDVTDSIGDAQMHSATSSEAAPDDQDPANTIDSATGLGITAGTGTTPIDAATPAMEASGSVLLAGRHPVAVPAAGPTDQHVVGELVPFARRSEMTTHSVAAAQAENTTTRPLRSGRRWFGGSLTQDEIEYLAQELFDSGKTQLSVNALVYIIGAAADGHAPTAIAAQLKMKAHSTVLRALNRAEELRTDRVA